MKETLFAIINQDGKIVIDNGCLLIYTSLKDAKKDSFFNDIRYNRTIKLVLIMDL